MTDLLTAAVNARGAETYAAALAAFAAEKGYDLEMAEVVVTARVNKLARGNVMVANVVIGNIYQS